MARSNGPQTTGSHPRSETTGNRVNVVGCGAVGKALARLWTQRGLLEVQSVLNRSLASGRKAAEFVGRGEPAATYAEMPPADITMISVPDEAIQSCCRELCRWGRIEKGGIVFHCSGSLTSTLLEPAKRLGAAVASVHPAKSFADPERAAATFEGTHCVMEGDPEACMVLRQLFERSGATVLPIQPQFKAVYHAATVIACNYLVALMEVGLQCFEKAGVPRTTALEIMRPLVTGALENVFCIGTVGALTGPIARGEVSIVAKQWEALAASNEPAQRVYEALGHVAVELSTAQGKASPEALSAIEAILQP